MDDSATLDFLRVGTMDPAASSAECRRIRKRAKNYVFSSSHGLFRQATGCNPARLVPPHEMRPELVHRYHNDMGHFGVRRTYSMLAKDHTWYNMLEDVKSHVDSCQPCQSSQVAFCSIPAELHPIPVKGIWHRLHIDLVGPLPLTPAGNKYLIVCMDSLSKWPEAAALPNKTAVATARFLRDLVSRHGCPSEIVTDNGSEFKGTFADVMEAHLIDHRFTAAYHPQANGLVERFNRTLITSLEKLAGPDSSSWEEHLPTALMGYRFSRQDSTGHSPYLLMYGRYPVLPGGVVQDSSPMDAPLDENVQLHAAAASGLQQSALANVEKAQERQIKSHAARHIHGKHVAKAAKVADLQPGMYVTLQTPWPGWPQAQVCWQYCHHASGQHQQHRLYMRPGGC